MHKLIVLFMLFVCQGIQVIWLVFFNEIFPFFDILLLVFRLESLLVQVYSSDKLDVLLVMEVILWVLSENLIQRAVLFLRVDVIINCEVLKEHLLPPY